jgi:hypothetical protein
MIGSDAQIESDNESENESDESLNEKVENEANLLIPNSG